MSVSRRAITHTQTHATIITLSVFPSRKASRYAFRSNPAKSEKLTSVYSCMRSRRSTPADCAVNFHIRTQSTVTTIAPGIFGKKFLHTYKIASVARKSQSARIFVSPSFQNDSKIP